MHDTIRAIHASEGPSSDNTGLQPINVRGSDRKNGVIAMTLGFAATLYVSTLSGCCQYDNGRGCHGP